MKIAPLSFAFLACCSIPLRCLAQLSPQQKVDDFTVIVDTYERFYAPLELALKDRHGEPLNAAPWLERAQRTASDAAFYQLSWEYLASFGNSQDTLGFAPGQLFDARLGFTVNFYDDTLLIDSIDRSALPAAQYPFQIGDQLLSVNNRSTDQWLAELEHFVPGANRAIRRSATADMITHRSSPLLPFTPERGESATISLRRQNGHVESYVVKWIEQGMPLAEFSPLSAQITAPAAGPFLATTLVNRQMPAGTVAVVGERALAPTFALPAGFQQHLGKSAADAFFSGTYTSAGRRLGFLRIGTFQPASAAAAAASLVQLDAEVQYLALNSDGLILDLMRNDGGDATYQEQVAQRFFATPFKTLAEQIRPSQSVLMATAIALAAAQKTASADPATINHLQQVFDELSSAYYSGRRLTRPLRLHASSELADPARDASGAVIAYSKPMLLLVDANTACGAEAFAAVFQDNRRGLVVGNTTRGAGGAIETQTAGVYTEAALTLTRTLFVRSRRADSEEHGDSLSYIQNSGVRPDLTLDYMTRANLLGNGQPFVNSMTAVMVRYLQATGSR